MTAWRSATFALALAALTCGGAGAQKYPDKPIRLVVPFPPGSASDFLARTISQKMTDALGQQLVVDNRAGAGGLIGSQITAKAAPDGYTVAMIGQPQITNVLLHKVKPYDPLADFTSVGQVASMPNVLVLGAGVPANSLTELIALAKANPGRLNFGSAGIGSSSHLAAEQFNRVAGIKAVHVPYKLIADIFTDLLAGRIQYYLFPLPAAMPMVKEGKLRAVAVATPKRAYALPDVPTTAEAGLPAYQSDSWFGIVGPARLPHKLVAQLNADLVKVLQSADTRERLLRGGAEPVTGSPEQFLQLQKNELEKIGRIVREAGIAAQ